MKRYIPVLFILMACICNAADAQPKLEIINGGTFDWHKVSPKDSPLKTKLQLKNVGNEKLIISNKKPSCGCTTAPLDKTELNPGETATMDVSVVISPHSGPIEKTIRVSSNDKTQPETIITLKADIFLALEVKPTNYFVFGEMKVGEETTAKVSIRNSSTEDISLTNFDVTPASMITNLSGKIVLHPGEEQEVTAKAKPDKKGYFNCNLKMKTTSVDFPELSIPGYGSVAESPIFNNK